jgi:hypothetical protein
MNENTLSAVALDEILKMLQEAGAPEAKDTKSYERLAYHLTVMTAYPDIEQPFRPNQQAVRLNSAVATLRKVLPEYIRFWEIAENVPNLPRASRERAEQLRKIKSLIEVAFPKDGRRSPKRGPHWLQVEPDVFEYRSGTPWHERALFIFAWYQSNVDEECGISRDGAAVRFVKAALRRTGKHLSEDAIEKALARALKAPRHTNEFHVTGAEGNPPMFLPAPRPQAS